MDKKLTSAFELKVTRIAKALNQHHNYGGNGEKEMRRQIQSNKVNVCTKDVSRF